MTFEQLLPQIGPWVRHLHTLWPATVIGPQFGVWQVPHILSMAVLGGTSILLNLRLIGVGLTEEAPSEVRRNLWPWLSASLVGVVASGLLIGMVNAERLYESDAFPPKMLALLAGIVVTYGVVGPTARAEGRVGRGAKVAGAVGLGLWLLALWLLGTGDLVSPGVFHVITAAALIALVATSGRLRWVYLTGLLALLAAQAIVTHVLIRPADYARLDPANIVFAVAFSVWIAGACAWQLTRRRRAEAPAQLAGVVGYVSIMIWVTVAAAGRWIGFA
jgi:hypothetical protein